MKTTQVVRLYGGPYHGETREISPTKHVILISTNLVGDNKRVRNGSYSRVHDRVGVKTDQFEFDGFTLEKRDR